MPLSAREKERHRVTRSLERGKREREKARRTHGDVDAPLEGVLQWRRTERRVDAEDAACCVSPLGVCGEDRVSVSLARSRRRIKRGGRTLVERARGAERVEGRLDPHEELLAVRVLVVELDELHLVLAPSAAVDLDGLVAAAVAARDGDDVGANVKEDGPEGGHA